MQTQSERTWTSAPAYPHSTHPHPCQAVTLSGPKKHPHQRLSQRFRCIKYPSTNIKLPSRATALTSSDRSGPGRRRRLSTQVRRACHYKTRIKATQTEEERAFRESATSGPASPQGRTHESKTSIHPTATAHCIFTKMILHFTTTIRRNKTRRASATKLLIKHNIIRGVSPSQPLMLMTRIEAEYHKRAAQVLI